MPIAHHELRVYKNRGVVITLAPSYEQLERDSLAAVEPLWAKYPKTHSLWEMLVNDREARANWDMADYMAVNKLKYNDHGLTHAIVASTNAIRIFDLLVQAGLAPEALDERRFSELLYTAGQPDPDLLIRTSGEMRVSNFLLWQIAYAEIWVTDTLWPDFRRRDLLRAIVAYQKRERRYGGIEPPPVALGAK